MKSFYLILGDRYKNNRKHLVLISIDILIDNVILFCRDIFKIYVKLSLTFWSPFELNKITTEFNVKSCEA